MIIWSWWFDNHLTLIIFYYLVSYLIIVWTWLFVIFDKNYSWLFEIHSVNYLWIIGIISIIWIIAIICMTSIWSILIIWSIRTGSVSAHSVKVGVGPPRTKTWLMLWLTTLIQLLADICSMMLGPCSGLPWMAACTAMQDIKQELRRHCKANSLLDPWCSPRRRRAWGRWGCGVNILNFAALWRYCAQCAFTSIKIFRHLKAFKMTCIWTMAFALRALAAAAATASAQSARHARQLQVWLNTPKQDTQGTV